MDSTSPFPAAAPAEGTRAQRSNHHHHAAASTKPWKSASAAKVTRVHSSSSKIPAPPGKSSGKKAENGKQTTQAPSSCGNGEKVLVKDEASEKTIPVEEKKKDEGAATDYGGKDAVLVAECEKNGVLVDHKENAAVEASPQLPIQPLLLSDEAPSTENSLTGSPAEQDPNSPLADTKAIVYSEQSSEFSANTDTAPECEETKDDLDVKQSGLGLIFTEHLNSEQEGFLFSKGEPVLKGETVIKDSACPESLPAGDCSTLKKSSEQDVSSLSQFEAAVRSSSDLNTASSAVLEVAHHAISTLPSSKATGFMEAAMVALAKDVLATKSSPTDDSQHSAVSQASFAWKLSRQGFLIPSLVVPTVLCIIWFISTVTLDNSHYLPPPT